jgi:hypothetical protein
VPVLCTERRQDVRHKGRVANERMRSPKHLIGLSLLCYCLSINSPETFVKPASMQYLVGPLQALFSCVDVDQVWDVNLAGVPDLLASSKLSQLEVQACITLSSLMVEATIVAHEHYSRIGAAESYTVFGQSARWST